MHLNKFAETILLGNTLQHKFCSLNETVEYPSVTLQNLENLQEPGRPEGLKFSDWWQKPQGNFPNKNEIRANSKRERGKVFHFFANHELLAMELMALCILKFPDSPESFRLGLARTIEEEQKHLKLYLERMAFFGVEFGEIAVNDFFWKFLCNMKSPQEFVSAMSLTFEQANLDFAKEYLDLFEEIQDFESANVMRTVYNEEIGHVKHGVSWANKWKAENETLWSFYIANLPKGLSPVRAKGSQNPIFFDFKARQLSGIDSHFAQQLFSYSDSKGRIPNAFWFSADEDPMGCAEGNKPKSIVQIETDFGTIPLFFASHDDIVICNKLPSTAFLDHLLKNGISVPRFETFESAKKSVKGFGNFFPWIWSEQNEKLASLLPAAGKKIQAEFSASRKNISSATSVYSKVWSKKISLEFLNTQQAHSQNSVSKNSGFVFSSLQELSSLNQELGESLFLIKAPFSSSGRHRCLWEPQNPQIVRKVQNWLQKYGCLLIEPYVKRVFDFSAQGTVVSGRVKFDGLCRFFTSNKGAFLGTIPSSLFGLESSLLKNSELSLEIQNELLELKKFFYSHKIEETMKQAVEFVGQKLLEQNFSGTFGIDALIHKKNNEFHLTPIVEVNARKTMGKVSLILENHISHKSVSLWTHFSLKRENNLELRNKIFAHKNVLSPSHQLVEGVLMTTEISEQTHHASLLMVGKNLEKIKEIFSNLNLAQPDFLS